jgi:hypothetical protein
LGGAQFVLVSLSDLGGSFRQFRLESSPCGLVLMIVLVLEQPERLLRAELRDSCEVLRAEPVQNLGASECARAQTQWAFNGFRLRRKTSLFIGQSVLQWSLRT